MALTFDETLFSTHIHWLSNFERQTGFIVKWEEITEYNFPNVPIELKPLLYAARSPETYTYVEPYPDAAYLIETAYTLGHTVICISSDHQSHAKCKRALLDRYFPWMPLVFTKPQHKWNVIKHIDVLIDDNPRSNATFYPAKPWNTACSPRVTDLRELLYYF